ncbi:MAG: shikimate kinase [Planctomycetota bacterium]|nr:shikimate kinase [Planctomycetota bacterium]
MSIFLTGYRGSGKTTVGRKLADRLWQEFVDCDDLIVRKAGKSIREIFAEHGEPHFRDLEAQAVSEAARLEDHVIALGAGAMMRDENRAAIIAGHHKVIYMRCEPEELHRRISGDAGTSDNRPALTTLGGNLDEIKTLLTQREPIYRSAMTAELDVTHLTPDEAVIYIVRLL